MATKAGPKSQNIKKLPFHLMKDPTDPVEFFEMVSDSVLYQWQREELAALSASDRPRVAYVQIPRKQGKSRFAAALILVEACMKPGRHIFICADSERNLNSVLMREIRDIVGQSPHLRDSIHLFKNHIEVPETGSTIETRAANFQATQGINPHLVVVDEVHLQKTADIWNGFQMAGAAREDALLLGITTPGYDLVSHAHSLYQAVKAGDPTIYGRIFEPTDHECAPADESLWPQSNPTLLEPKPERFYDSMRFDLARLPEHEFKRFRLGLWTATASAWLPYGLWDGLKDPQRTGKPAPGTRVVLGFDGSISNDSTALVGCTEDGYLWIEAIWEKPGSNGWTVPQDEVMEAVDLAMHNYEVAEFVYDPAHWRIQGQLWEKLYGAKKIVEHPCTSARMAPACSDFYSACADRRISHDGDPRLARHISNAVTKDCWQGTYISKADKNSPAKIDAAIAAVLAHSAASRMKKRRSPLAIA